MYQRRIWARRLKPVTPAVGKLSQEHQEDVRTGNTGNSRLAWAKQPDSVSNNHTHTHTRASTPEQFNWSVLVSSGNVSISP